MRRAIALAGMVVLVPGLVQAQTPPPPACDAAEHRQFDFWVGSWSVTSGGKPAGTNEITREERGCVLHERWTGTGGSTGQSFNFYDRSAKKWRQVWIDSAGNPLDLWGGMSDGKMILSGKTSTPKGVSLQRITWSKEADGAVRQLWETSNDEGKTWSVAFDGFVPAGRSLTTLCSTLAGQQGAQYTPRGSRKRPRSRSVRRYRG